MKITIDKSGANTVAVHSQVAYGGLAVDLRQLNKLILRQSQARSSTFFLQLLKHARQLSCMPTCLCIS